MPRERKVTDYYAVEYQTEYIPQVFQEKYTGSLSNKLLFLEYMPVERV
jgi:hypothetical protein